MVESGDFAEEEEDVAGRVRGLLTSILEAGNSMHTGAGLAEPGSLRNRDHSVPAV